MAITGRTVFRFFGATLLALGATTIDQPRTMDDRLPAAPVGIAPGKRAFSFRINDVSGIAGLIAPNSRVDLVLVVASREKRKISRVFMTNMRVLAIAANTERTEDGRPMNAATCTVEVTPEEGEHLAVATTQGQIQLMLRGYGDPDSAKSVR